MGRDAYHPATRLEATPEAGAVVVNVYGHLFQASAEITAPAARRLAAELIQSAEYLEANGHAED